MWKSGNMSVWLSFLYLLPVCFGQAGVAAEAFGPPQRLATGQHPSAAAIADVTGDDFADLLVVTQGSNELLVFTGDGQGSLALAGRFDAGPNPSSLAVGDFDEDIDLDVAITNHDTHFLTVLLNEDGGGTFVAAPGSPLVLSVGPHPHVVRTHDMDQDGHLDLLIDDRRANGYALLPGVGNGSFSGPSKHIYAGGDPYQGMAVGDLNNDERPDIVAPLSNSVTVVLTQDESYERPRAVVDDGAFAVELADLNGDQQLDLIRATESGKVEALRGLGGGIFKTIGNWSTASGAKRIAAGDFNADNVGDFVVQNYIASELFIMFGDTENPEPFMLGAGTHPWGLAIGDLNGDGHDDLVSLDYGNDVALVFLSLPGQ